VAVEAPARLLAVAAFAVGAWLGPCEAASAAGVSHCPDSQPCVAVIVGGAAVDTFTVAQVEAGDIQNGPVYEIRQPRATACTDSDPIAAGSSISSLLSQSTVSLTNSGHVEVTSPGVASLDLTAAEVSANGGGQFYDGQIPVVYGDGASSSIAFIRGLLASPAPCPPTGPQAGADSNAGAQGDFFGVSEIDLTVYGGPTLGVTMTPSPATATTGKPVTFTADVAGGDAAYIYHWTFGDGAAVTTFVDHVSYPYDAAGSYVAQVTVDGSDGTTGISAPDTVSVGSRPTKTGTTPNGGGATPSPGPSSGPAKGSGHRTDAPSSATHTGVDSAGHPSRRTPSATPAAGRARRTGPTAGRTTAITGELLGDPLRFIPAAETKSWPLVVGSAPAAAAGSGNSPLALSCGIAVAALLVATGAARELRRAPPASRVGLRPRGWTVIAGRDRP
jgi:hypothetical protein